MDPNSALSAGINAISPSVRSLVSLFGRLRMNRGTGDGPINRLPNEMMLLIVAKLGQDKDVNKLVRLRLVSTKWKSLVEDYFAQKKSLIVQPALQKRYSDERFFGFSKVRNFTNLHLFYLHLISKEFTLSCIVEFPYLCLSHLLQMFPNIEQLSLSFDDAHFHHFAWYINSLNSLKQLNLEGAFVADIYSIFPTLSKLEHFSLDYFNLKDPEHRQLISHLGPGCVRFFLRGELTYDLVHQWQRINPLWLANITHLRIGFKNGHKDGDQLVHFLAKYATSLKHLSLHFEYSSPDFKMTPYAIGEFAKMTNLAELKLEPVVIDFSELEQAAVQHRLASLSSVLNCRLVCSVQFLLRSISTVDFALVISIIFPNLANLVLRINNAFGHKEYVREEIERQFEQNFDRFPNLLKDDIYIWV